MQEGRRDLRASPEAVREPGPWSERTPADLSSLLVELGRVLKGVAFYGPGNATAARLSDRAFRAWQADLRRAGPLALRVTEAGFASEGMSGCVGADHVAELAAALRDAGVVELRIHVELRPEPFLSFVESLHDRERVERVPVVSSVPGIEINGVPCAPEPIETQESETTLSTTDVAPGTRTAVLPEQSPAKPRSETGSTALLERLKTLDPSSASDDEYLVRVAQLTSYAQRQGTPDEVDRTLVVLAGHAAGEGRRSELTARVAAEALVEIATSAGGEPLERWIARACSDDGDTSVRAAQMLLQIGEAAGVALLDCLEREPHGPRSDRLAGLLIALGDVAVPTLAAAIEPRRGSRARLAIRLAGELQCAQLAAPLGEILCAPDTPLRKDAAKALVEIGNAAAVDALLRGLESGNDSISEVSAFCLGALGDPRSLRPLVDRLCDATRRRRWRLVREIVRTIGQFERCDGATAEKLANWIGHREPPWRRPEIALKLEAVTALGQLSRNRPAPLHAIAHRRRPRLDERLRERARQLLARRHGATRPDRASEPLQ